jgi:hypothetical protein
MSGQRIAIEETGNRVGIAHVDGEQLFTHKTSGSLTIQEL